MENFSVYKKEANITLEFWKLFSLCKKGENFIRILVTFSIYIKEVKISFEFSKTFQFV